MLLCTVVGIMMGACISGNFFTGLLLALGADDLYISALNMATTLTAMLQLFSPLLLERIKRRKPLLLAVRATSHLLNVVLLGVLPILPMHKNFILTCYFIVILCFNSLSALFNAGVTTWHMQSVPQEKLSSYFTLSNFITTLLSYVFSFLTAQFIDNMTASGSTFLHFSVEMSPFMILRIFAFACAILDIFFCSRIREYEYPASDNTGHNILDGFRLITLPLRNKRFILSIGAGVYAILVGRWLEKTKKEN